MQTNNWPRDLLLTLALVAPALAGMAAEPVTPGSVGDTLKQPLPLQAPVGVPPAQPPAKPARGKRKGGGTLRIQRFDVSGNTLFSKEVLQDQLAGYVGKVVGIAELFEAADKLGEFYARQGYPLASVNIPAQGVTDGVVRLEVVEGRIGTVSYEGNKVYKKQTLQEFVSQTQEGAVYKAGALESDLQELNGLPGVRTRAILKPGTVYGTTDAVIKIEEQRYEGEVVLDNYGQKSTGRYRVIGQLGINNPLGVADRLDLAGLHTDSNGLNYGYAAYSLPVDNHGLRVKASYGYAHFQVAPPIGVEGKNVTAAVSFEKPWIRTFSDNFVTRVGLSYTDADANLDTLQIINTQIGLLDATASYSHKHPDAAVSQYTLNLRTNFRQATQDDREKQRLRLELDAQHLEPLPKGFQLLGHVDGVFSPDPLADTEKFAIGGPDSLRAFASSEARGDRGAFGALILRRPFLWKKLVVAPQVFAETGVAISLDAGPGGADSRNSLSDLGLGADVQYRKFSFKVDWAYPLDSRPVSDGLNDGRFYAALSASL